MADLNVVAIVGRLTRDSELRYTQSGNGILHFSIAVNRRKRTADNSWQDEASFFDCAMFGKNTQTMAGYLKKGRQVSIVGELRQDRWGQQDSGQQRSRVEIVVNSLQLLGGGDRGQQGMGGGGYQNRDSQAAPASESRQSAPASASASAPAEDGVAQFDDDTIPF